MQILENTDVHGEKEPAAPVANQYTLLKTCSEPRMENQ
jgi:hypothetical protein